MTDFRDKMQPFDIRISDEDIYAAMKDIPGYLDITPGDFKDLYHHACTHALARIAASMIIGSFGASAVLIYGAVRSPLAQPRNLVGGHLISASIGVAFYNMFQDHLWVASALAVATAIAAMHATKTLHPPGGATALIAVIGGDKIHDLGYLYVAIPTGAGALIMLIVALVVNNLCPSRKYPGFWV